MPCHCEQPADKTRPTDAQADKNRSHDLLLSQWGGSMTSKSEDNASFEVSVNEDSWNNSMFVIYDVTKPQKSRFTGLDFKYLDNNNLLQPIPKSISKLIITIMNNRIAKQMKQFIAHSDFNADSNKTLKIKLGEVFNSTEIDKLISLIEKDENPITYGKQKVLTRAKFSKNSGVGDAEMGATFYYLY